MQKRKEEKVRKASLRQEEEYSLKNTIDVLNTKVDTLDKNINAFIVGKDCVLANSFMNFSLSISNNLSEGIEKLQTQNLTWLNESDELFQKKLQEFQINIYDDSQKMRDVLKAFMDNVNRDLKSFREDLKEFRKEVLITTLLV